MSLYNMPFFNQVTLITRFKHILNTSNFLTNLNMFYPLNLWTPSRCLNAFSKQVLFYKKVRNAISCSRKLHYIIPHTFWFKYLQFGFDANQVSKLRGHAVIFPIVAWHFNNQQTACVIARTLQPFPIQQPSWPPTNQFES